MLKRHLKLSNRWQDERTGFEQECENSDWFEKEQQVSSEGQSNQGALVARYDLQEQERNEVCLDMQNVYGLFGVPRRSAKRLRY